MSLILEALKKSEAERRLGQAPGLLDPSPYSARRRRNPWLLVVTIGILLAAVAIAAYWLGQQEHAQPAETLSARPAASREPAAQAMPEPALNAPRPAPAAAATPRAIAQPRLPADPGFGSVEREARPQSATEVPAPAPATTAVAPPLPRRVESTPFDSSQAGSAQASSTPADLTQADQSPTASTPPALSPADPRPASAAATPRADAPPMLSSLGPERRGRLPALKVSMHVYAENPAERVVLIDGHRLREGDELQPGLRLVEIRRDGSVLEVDGQRFLLPRS